MAIANYDEDRYLDLTDSVTQLVDDWVANGAGAEHGLAARYWECADRCRWYLTRELSRGRRQDVGYVEVLWDECEETIEVNWSADRIRSTVRDLASLIETHAAEERGA